MSKEAIAEAEEYLKELEGYYNDFMIDSNDVKGSHDALDRLKESIKKQEEKIANLKRGPASGAPKGGKSRKHRKSKKATRKARKSRRR